jgi:GDPmannose 4,6-dehydratase
MKRALICGISGQDGAYLAKYLLDNGYEVHGTSRDANVSNFKNLVRLGIREQIKLESMALTDFRSVFQTLTKSRPDEIYNLAGQTSVGLSFEQPVETFESITVGTLNLLEVIRFQFPNIKLYNACSSECFGDTGTKAGDETTPFRPRSPYAVAKASAFWQVANYREGYGLFACSGILSNHESPLRPERFVTKKIVTSACRIANGSTEKLWLGNVAISRDWGWAPEYVEAMWKMLQRDEPDDFVIATGESHSLQEFIKLVFSALGLDWSEHVQADPQLYRPTDLMIGKADPTKAFKELGWKARYKMADVARMMVQAENSRYAEEKRGSVRYNQNTF